jgi:2-oxoglutarate dehydrogenase E2 component (dihydrolipoamide succinyltransferase)
MPILAAALAALAFAGCGTEAPPAPKPAAKAPPPAAQPAPQAAAKAEPAPAPAPAPVAAPDPNKELAARVKHALEGEAKIHAGGIDVSAAGGKVTLWGTADSDGERRRAAQVAAAVSGVTSVENKIEIVRGS